MHVAHLKYFILCSGTCSVFINVGVVWWLCWNVRGHVCRRMYRPMWGWAIAYNLIKVLSHSLASVDLYPVL